jgi:hypothetical protein
LDVELVAGVFLSVVSLFSDFSDSFDSEDDPLPLTEVLLALPFLLSVT